jgi:hypothetical protein
MMLSPYTMPVAECLVTVPVAECTVQTSHFSSVVHHLKYTQATRPCIMAGAMHMKEEVRED